MINLICDLIESRTTKVVGTDLFPGHFLPSNPDRASVVLETGAGVPNFDLALNRRIDLVVQILSRAHKIEDARADAWEIYDTLQGKSGLLLGTPGTELFPAGNFENWVTPTNVRGFTEVLQAGVTINRESVNPHSGTYCLRVDATNTNFGGIITNNEVGYLCPRLTEGKYYRISWWMKANGLGAIAVWLNLLNVNYLPAGKKWGFDAIRKTWQRIDLLGLDSLSFSHSIKNTTWEQLTFDAKLDLDGSGATNVDIYFTTRLFPGAGCSIWLDDISFKELINAYDTQVIEAIAIPQHLEIDEKKRHVFSTNYMFRIKKCD